MESDPQWYIPTSLEELAALYTAKPNSKIKLITATQDKVLIIIIGLILQIISEKVVMDKRMTLYA